MTNTKKKILSSLTALTLTLGLSACSETESSSVSRDYGLVSQSQTSKSNSGREEYSENFYLAKYVYDNPCCFLPDGLDIDEAYQSSNADYEWFNSDDQKSLYTVLEADGSGYVHSETLGVDFKLPDGYTAYYFPMTYSCGGSAILLTNSSFPQVNDYILISMGTTVSANINDYSDASDYYAKNGDSISEQEYIDSIAEDLKSVSDFLASGENVYLYNYIDIPTENDLLENPDSTENSRLSVVGNGYRNLFTLSVFSNEISHANAPESEISKVETQTSTADRRTDLKLKYHSKRYGIETDKDVYWVADEDTEYAKRVEFSYDSRTESEFDEEGFLGEFTSFKPDYEE